jgi:transposase
MHTIFEQALNLEYPWFIRDLKFDYENKRLDIKIDFVQGSKFEYTDSNGEIQKAGAHDTKEKVWRHLNFFEHECYITARVPRIRKDDNKVKIIKTPWEGKMNGFTLLFEALLLQMCTAMPILKVSQIVNVSDDKLWSMLDRYITEAVSQIDLSELKVLGLDETSKAKHHDYITLFVDMIKKKIVYIAEGKDSNTIKEFSEFLIQQNGNKQNVSDVSSDMSPAFIKGINKYLPNAEITFDKFHILKLINEAVDQVRRQEVKEQEILKGTKFIFLKNNSNLTNKQREALAELKISKLNLKTIRALHIRENFQEIYNSFTNEDFEIKLKKWYYWATHSRIESIKKVAKTIKAHWDGVLQWWNSKINNGILEGLNSVIQAAKAKARGYKLAKNFKIISYLLVGDIDLNMLNPNFSKLGS